MPNIPLSEAHRLASRLVQGSLQKYEDPEALHVEKIDALQRAIQDLGTMIDWIDTELHREANS